MKTKSQAKRIQAQTTVKAWAVVDADGDVWSRSAQYMIYRTRYDARMNAFLPQGDRVVRCEIRLLK